MSKIPRLQLILIVIFIATLACGTPAVEPTSTALSATIVPFTSTPSPPPPTDTPTPEPSPTPTPITIPANMLSGLVYRKYDAETKENILWQFNADGISTSILNTEYALFSPDYSYAAYINDGVWVVDIKQKITQKLNDSWPLGWYSQNQLVMLGGPDILIRSIPDNKATTISTLWASLICSSTSPTKKTTIMQPGDGPVPAWVEFYLDESIQGKLPEVLKDQRGNIYCPAWSPNGEYMASLMTGYKENERIYGVGVQGINTEFGAVFHPTHDRFKSYEAALSLGSEHYNIYYENFTTWASDNQHIAFATQAEDKTISFWVATIDGQTEYQLPNWPIWNPAKPLLAYWDFALDPANPELWIMDSNGENAQQVGTRSGGNATEAYLSTLWSPDGEFLLYQDVDGTLWLTDFDTRQAHQVAIDFTGELVTWIPPLNITLSDLVALPTPIPFSCPNAPASRLQVGQTARVTVTGSGGTRLRSSPDVLPDNILASLVEGQEFEIIGGPVCSERPGRTDAYVYWEISLPERNLTGWVAEGDFEAYYIEPWP